jgi:DNA polymerase (family 10)
MGVKRGLKINEYGVFKGARRIGGRTEEEVYRAVGLRSMPPELREDRGELEAARRGRLPALVETDRIRGDLQMHTDATDGADGLEAMVRACRERGYAYIAITDHTKSQRVAGGMDDAGFRRQGRAIEALRLRRPGLAVFKSAEVDILPDGRLDLDDATLDSLDIVMVAVHLKFNMTEPAMTERVLRALRHPKVRIFAHPTGRILGRREPYPIDMARIARAAADIGVLLEIDAQPERLDLDDVHVKMAKEAGARFVIDTDAHRSPGRPTRDSRSSTYWIRCPRRSRRRPCGSTSWGIGTTSSRRLATGSCVSSRKGRASGAGRRWRSRRARPTAAS